jgi:predicted Rdx family selenoprotein
MAGPGDMPLMLLSRQGEGRVAAILSDHVWLWARGFDGGGPQAEVLRRLAHWLMKEPELEEEALFGVQRGNTLEIVRQTMAETAAPVTVTSPAGKVEKVNLALSEPGRFSVRIEVAEAGIWRLEDGTFTAVAAVGSPDPRETASLHATADLLEPLVAAAGGAVRWLSSQGSDPAAVALPRFSKVKAGRAMAGPGWLGLKANGAYRVRAVSELPLFSTLVSLALLLAALSLMWYREGR